MTSIPLVTLENPYSESAKAFRLLGASIMSCSGGLPPRTLLATSPGSLVGQTTTIANLAVVMAQANQRVIVVDCNLLHPTLHTMFSFSNNQQLFSHIESINISSAIQETEVPGIGILTINSVLLQTYNVFSPEYIKVVLPQLQQYADIILFDAPPVNNFTDTSLLATQVDGVILILRAGKTKGRHARKACRLLDKAKANILGAVLTGIDSEIDHFGGESVINQTISFNFGIQSVSY
jgi:capsular exopolysaccharide synthesis family protein